MTKKSLSLRAHEAGLKGLEDDGWSVQRILPRCGCAEKDAYECEMDQWRNGFGATTPPRCQCVCHDEHERKAKRLKLKPEENRK